MNLNDLQNAWQAFNRATHISPIRDEKHYTEMVSLADCLSEVIGSAKKHPLLDLFDLVSELIPSYDAGHYAVPDASPREVLHFLMDQHGLAQSDLPEAGNQSVISMLLSRYAPIACASNPSIGGKSSCIAHRVYGNCGEAALACVRWHRLPVGPNCSAGRANRAGASAGTDRHTLRRQ